MLDDYRATRQGGDADAAVGKQGRRIGLVLLEKLVGFGWERGCFLAIEKRQQLAARRNQDAAVIERMKKKLAGVLVGVAARNVPNLVPHNLLQADAVLCRIDAAPDHRERLESGLGHPDVHLLAVPAKEPLIGPKENALWSGQHLPDVGNRAMLRRHFVKQRNVMQASGSVRLQVPEVLARAHPDSPVIVHGQ